MRHLERLGEILDQVVGTRAVEHLAIRLDHPACGVREMCVVEVRIAHPLELGGCTGEVASAVQRVRQRIVEFICAWIVRVLAEVLTIRLDGGDVFAPGRCVALGIGRLVAVAGRTTRLCRLVVGERRLEERISRELLSSDLLRWVQFIGRPPGAAFAEAS